MNTIDGPNVFTNSECSSYGDNAVFTTADGIIFCISNFAIDPNNHINSTCDMYDKHPCTDIDGPNLWIDVNGERNPNRPTILAKHPKDIFQAQIYVHKIVPYGEAETKIILGNDDKSTISDDTNKGNSGSNTPSQGGSNSNSNYDDNNSPYEDNYIPEENPNENYGDNETGNTSDDNKNNKDNNSNTENNNNEQLPPDENLENEDLGGEELNPEDMPDPDNPYYDQWDPNKWPSWLEFLRWLLGQIAKIFN